MSESTGLSLCNTCCRHGLFPVQLDYLAIAPLTFSFRSSGHRFASVVRHVSASERLNIPPKKRLMPIELSRTGMRPKASRLECVLVVVFLFRREAERFSFFLNRVIATTSTFFSIEYRPSFYGMRLSQQSASHTFRHLTVEWHLLGGR